MTSYLSLETIRERRLRKWSGESNESGSSDSGGVRSSFLPVSEGEMDEKTLDLAPIELEELDWDLRSASPSSVLSSAASLWSQLDSFPQLPIPASSPTRAPLSPSSPRRFLISSPTRASANSVSPSSPRKSLSPVRSRMEGYQFRPPPPHSLPSTPNSLDSFRFSTTTITKSNKFDPLFPPQETLPLLPRASASKKETTSSRVSSFQSSFSTSTTSSFQSALFPAFDISTAPLKSRHTNGMASTDRSPPSLPIRSPLESSSQYFRATNAEESSSSEDEFALSILRASLADAGMSLDLSESDLSSEEDIPIDTEEKSVTLLRRKSLFAINSAAKRQSESHSLFGLDESSAQSNWSPRKSIPYKLMRRPSDIPASPLASNTNRMESEAREELCSSDEEELFDRSLDNFTSSGTSVSSHSNNSPFSSNRYRFPDSKRRSSDSTIKSEIVELGVATRRRTLDLMHLEEANEMTEEERRIKSWNGVDIGGSAKANAVKPSALAKLSPKLISIRRVGLKPPNKISPPIMISLPTPTSTALLARMDQALPTPASNVTASKMKPPSTGLRKLNLIAKTFSSPPSVPVRADSTSPIINTTQNGISSIPRKSLPYLPSIPSGKRIPVPMRRQVNGVAL